MAKLKPGEYRANGDGLAHGRYKDGTPYIRGKPKNSGVFKITNLFKSKPKRAVKRKFL